MAQLAFKCPTCGKDAQVVREAHLPKIDKIMSILDCGHIRMSSYKLRSEEELEQQRREKFKSIDGKKELFDFQQETLEFVERAGGRAIINHEMGLGKMVIECAYLKRNPEIRAALIICPANVVPQWFNHLVYWGGIVPDILVGKHDRPHFDHFKVFIVSVDSLWRQKWIKDEEVVNQFKHVCIDEVQMIKNPESKRTKGVQAVGHNRDSVITLSGTTIENHAGEYFVPLNLVRPDMFGSWTNFLRTYCDYYFSGTGQTKIGAIKDPLGFKERTKDFIIRFKREEVLSELPLVWRKFQHAEMRKEDVDAYTKVVEEFQEWFDEHDGAPGPGLFTNLLAYFARMRHITGISKVNDACAFVEEHLLTTNRKITLFVHHKTVADLLEVKLREICKDGGFAPPLNVVGMDAEERFPITDSKFWEPENRILIASTLASGTGINLQCCADALFVEREWNPAKEEQAESRFPRPGQTADKINATYLIASGTIDEFLTELVEIKRENKDKTLDGEAGEWREQSLMKELGEILSTKGLKKWR